MAKKPKANGSAAPDAPPAHGANTQADDTANCFLDLNEIDSQIASLGQKKARTIARYENIGVDVDAVRECQKLARKDDAPDWIKRIVAAAGVLKIIPTETEDDGQISLMPGLKVAAASTAAQSRIAVARAHGDGYNSGKHGGSADNNPHAAGTEEYVAWGNGCIDGEADRAIAKQLREDKKAASRPANVTVASTEKRKPGRPSKADKAAAEEAAGKTPLENDETAYRAKGEMADQPAAE